MKNKRTIGLIVGAFLGAAASLWLLAQIVSLIGESVGLSVLGYILLGVLGFGVWIGGGKLYRAIRASTKKK